MNTGSTEPGEQVWSLTLRPSPGESNQSENSTEGSCRRGRGKTTATVQFYLFSGLVMCKFADLLCQHFGVIKLRPD